MRYKIKLVLVGPRKKLLRDVATFFISRYIGLFDCTILRLLSGQVI